MKYLSAFVVFSICQFAYASDWQTVSMEEESLISVDRNSIRQSSSGLKAWVQYLFKKDQLTDERTPRKYKVIRTLEYFDCGERKSGRTEVLMYKSLQDLKVVYSFSAGEFPNYRDVSPDSLGEMVLDYVCKNQPSNNG